MTGLSPGNNNNSGGGSSSLPVPLWSVDDVIVWLCDQGFGQYEDTFRGNQVDGETLLGFQEPKELKTELDITVLKDRRALFRLIQQLQGPRLSFTTEFDDYDYHHPSSDPTQRGCPQPQAQAQAQAQPQQQTATLPAAQPVIVTTADPHNVSPRNRGTKHLQPLRLGGDRLPQPLSDSMVSPQQAEAMERIKIVVVGQSGVGKTSLMSQYTRETFSVSVQPTVGIEFDYRKVKCPDGQEVRVQVWDTAGQERFRAIAPSFYHSAHGALLVYDVTDRESFTETSKWIKELEKYAPPKTVKILIGNKLDLAEEAPARRQVPRETGEEFGRQNNIAFMEASAKTKHNVDRAFQWLIYNVLQAKAAARLEAHARANHSGAIEGNVVHLTKPREPKGGRCCGSS
eukprot:TRINITY_DN3172_c0_g1_i4.p1 TRINITY_DN3172_c0_g1~~TRINITY_DN3172_c0_g1_i4.p1  ORF type:complete len:447 (+),score=99.89 TRINITY_DN3172_c0_g1_i4:146-1342(+)